MGSKYSGMMLRHFKKRRCVYFTRKRLGDRGEALGHSHPKRPPRVARIL
jgi:hypothetical protein